ncbi:hypothetical protein FACS1894132_06910 [Clostridia bacterium]|nr:hypothetical protein FACS1894132_06910 [Clostridia bacterium]
MKTLVLGTADFSMPYLCTQVGIKNLSISDICETPLHVCNFIANTESYRWRTFQSDVLTGIDGIYDVIVNDAFLTRFDYDTKRCVLAQIADSLMNDGKYITTIRKGWRGGAPVIPDTAEQVEFVRNAVSAAYKRGIPVEKVEQAAKDYIAKMVSYPISNEDMLKKLCNGIFEIEAISTITTTGECAETVYFEIVLSKN